MDSAPQNEWISRFEELAELDDEARRFLRRHAQVVKVDAGQTVFAPGKKPDSFLLVLEGTVRVQQVAANGREIVLYRVSGGESCIMTTACLLADEHYLAEGVTETPVTAVAIAQDDFDRLMASSAVFRRLVFAKYGSRMTDLMHLIEDVAFERMDKRLAQKLLDLSEDSGAVLRTHQALAVELGSAREVVSRLLKEFERRHWVAGGRGQVEILDRTALERLADEG